MTGELYLNLKVKPNNETHFTYLFINFLDGPTVYREAMKGRNCTAVALSNEWKLDSSGTSSFTFCPQSVHH
jgi:hypothetical protein